MKYTKPIALLLTLCLLLSACGENTLPGDNEQDPPPLSNEQQQPEQNEEPDAPNTGDDSSQTSPSVPYFPSEMTMELVADSETANILLSHLDELAEYLRCALEDVGCPPDSVILSFSTAGAYTADSLHNGGICAAILPAVDIIEYEHSVSIIALSSEEIPEFAIAVTTNSDSFSDEFSSILFKALTETPSGQAFLSICCTNAVFSASTEDGLKAVREHLKELEKNSGGHIR